MLEANRGRCFQGPIPGGDFYLRDGEASALLALPDAPYADVVRPYLIGEDITDDPGQAARRHVIDFGTRDLEHAMRYPAALALVRERVKPTRDHNRRKTRRERWWRWAEVAVGLRGGVQPLQRFIAGNAQGKRFLFAWQQTDVCPSNLTNVFAFDGDYAMGVITSCVHQAWARSESSTLRIDLRYTPTSCFETFPWPMPSADQRERITAAAEQLIAERQAITIREAIGLTALYNATDDGAWKPVADLHRRLDVAVLAAYGWPATLRDDPLEQKARLAALHAQIGAGRVAYAPF
ncbi:MAG: type IIL restriction-modification enzyme MmeI [Solirubrobacteraceae bacterium]